jgi:hypothetical protein
MREEALLLAGVPAVGGSERARSEHAEFIALRVPKHNPGLLALTYVRWGGSQRQQSLDLGVPVVRPKVEVQPILDRLRLWDRDEQEPRNTVRSRSDLEFVRILVDDDPTERLSPPAPKPARVACLDDRLLPLEGHWTILERLDG